MKETIVKINKTKSWFFEKINKLDKPLARHIKKKREKNQINKIRNEKGEVTPDNVEIHKIIRHYYEQLYGNKIDNLEEMDRFVEKFNLLRLNQEEIEIMNNPITSTEIDAMVKNLPKTKAQDQTALQEISIKHVGKSYAYPSKTLSKYCRGRNPFQTHSVRPDTKTRQRQHKKRKLQANITDEHRCKNPQ